MTKIIVDGMLGNVAKWLRLLGIDTYYERDLEDDKLIELASKYNAILITGDEELSFKAFRKNIKVILLKNKLTKKSMIKKVLSELNINKNNLEIGSRCIRCNNLLKPIDKNLISNKLPKKIIENNDEFWYCDKCDKIYWYGSHWRNIEKELNEILA